MTPPKADEVAKKEDPIIRPLKLNPEAIPDLPGDEDIKVVFIQPALLWARVTEGVVVHLIGHSINAALIATLIYFGTMQAATSTSPQPKSCMQVELFEE